jgi:hypothetical protein
MIQLLNWFRRGSVERGLNREPAGLLTPAVCESLKSFGRAAEI